MRILFFLLYLLIAKNAFGQNGLISFPFNDIVYLGIENEIRIEISEEEYNNLVVEATNGVLKKNCPVCFGFVPDDKERFSEIKIGLKKKDKLIWIDSAIVRFRKLPKPEALLYTKQGGNISKLELLESKRINAAIGEGIPIEGLKFEVKSYNIKLISGGTIYTETVSGKLISEPTKAKFKDLNNGDIIIIDEIEVLHKDKFYKALPIVLTVKNS